MDEFNEGNDSRDMEEAANVACSTLLPEKSKIRYYQVYEAFCKWCTTKDIQGVSETAMLSYFEERAEILKSPASLWSEYSMLKLTIMVQQNKDISKFERLKAYLKMKNDGYQPRKSKNFTKEEIDKFITEAPDENFLMMKVVAIIAVAGACRTDELYRMKYKDIQLKDDLAIVNIIETRNNIRRSFVIMKNAEHADWLKLVQNYIKLRPLNAVDDRFFFRYERGRCVNQVVGKHTIATIPRQVAKFLKLDNISEYTGHAFRKTTPTFQTSTSESNIFDMKHHGQTEMSNEHDIVTNDFENICRTCLSKDNLKPLYKKCSRSICFAEMLMSCTVLKFVADDDLPAKICANCINELDQAFSFVKRVETTDAILRSCMKIKTQLENDLSQTVEPKIEANDEIKIEIPEVIFHQTVEKVAEDYEFVAVKQEEEMIIDEYYDETCDNPEDESYEEDVEHHQNHASCEETDDFDSALQIKEESLKDEDNSSPAERNNSDFHLNEINPKHSFESKMLKRHFPCMECDRVYPTKRLLLQHSVVHEGKTYDCSVCTRSFNKQYLLKSHSRCHTGVRPYACHICEKSFTKMGHLRAHELIHKGEKPHACSVCSKAFTEPSNLKCHMRMHTGEKPYSCEVCGKNFPAKANLTVHCRIHTGETPYVCSICEKGFYCASNMRKHKRGHAQQQLVSPE